MSRVASLRQLQFIQEIVDNKLRQRHDILIFPKINPVKLSLDDFLLKPVLICSPDELIDGGKLLCTCKKVLTHDGWAEARYLHTLHEGYYVKQRKYKCTKCIDYGGKTKHISGLHSLELPSVSDGIRFMFPIFEKKNSLIYRDVINYIVSDALTGTAWKWPMLL